MDKYLQLLPLDIYNLIKNSNNSFKISVYPILITYYIDSSNDYSETKVKTTVKTCIKKFTEFLNKLEEDVKLPSNLITFISSIGPSLYDVGIGMKVNQLNKGPVKYKNFEKKS